MYYELYIDVLFLENLLVDYLLLRLLGRLLKCPAKRLRSLLAAALGSLGICILYAFSMERAFIGNLLIYVVISTVMVKTGLRIKALRPLGRAVALLYICSLLLGGIFQWIQERFRLPVYPFLGFSLISYGMLSACMTWLCRWKSRYGKLLEVTISFRGKTIRTLGLLDTGNHLRDPVFGRPVSILTGELSKPLCEGEEILYQHIPFHSIGERNGMMEAFSADYLCIRTAEGETKLVERPLLGITKEPLSSKNEYGMILHPDLLS